MPRIIYKNAKGNKIPSVTTIIGQNLGWSAQPLQYYWWKQGIATAVKAVKEDIKGNVNSILNQTDEEYVEDIRTSVNWKEPLSKAASIGTAAHEMIDCEQKFVLFDKDKYDLSPEEWKKVYQCHSAWCRWAKQSKLKIIDSEESIVSEKHQYGGTLDAKVCEVDGTPSILDLKTCNGIYESHLIQLVAYGKAYEEISGKDIEQYHIIQIKKNGAFCHHNYMAGDLEPAWDTFLLLRQLHDMKKKVKAI